jgi:Fuc2NAc and GlcNAc transferase
MSVPWLLIVASIALSWLVASLVSRRAEQWRLVQIPNHRSSHVQPTANGGGLGIVLASVATGGWLALAGASQLSALLVLSLPLAVIGLIDDVRHVSAMSRMGVQVIVMVGLLTLVGEGPAWESIADASPYGWPLMGVLILAGVWWINLFNFMDGIDGIAGGQVIFMLVAGTGLASWFHPEAVRSPMWAFAICVAAATLGFLPVNWPPARVFMGNVGSTWLAFMIFAVALVSIQAGWLSPAVWLVLGAGFVTDATITLIIRMLRGERWYEAHRSHAYQRLSRRWRGDRNMGHLSVTVLVSAINLLWLAPLAWACLNWPQWSIAWLTLAYGPVAVCTMLLGAGRPDHA